MRHRSRPSVRARLSAAAHRAAPALAEPIERRVLLSAGQLDPTYGDGGLGTTYNTGDSVVVEPGGRAVVDGFNVGRQLVRYTAAGQVDSTFAAVPESSNGLLALTPGGDLLSAGATLQEFTADGVPVTSFGNNGSATNGTGQPLSLSDPVGLAVQSDGRIDVLYGAPNDANTVEQFTAAGAPDATFGTGGIVTLPAEEVSSGLALTPGGQVVVFLYGYEGNVGPGAVERFTTAGTPDPTFGTNGVAVDPAGSSGINAGTVGPDGSVYVSTTYPTNAPFGSTSEGSTITKLTSTGQVDTAFGPDGTGTVQFVLPKPASSYDGSTSVTGLAVQPDGNIVLSGNNGNYFSDAADDIYVFVARLRPDGSIDTTFGDGTHGSTNVTSDTLLGGNPTVAFDAAGNIYTSEGPGKLLAGGGTTGIYFVNGVLTVNGTAGNDTITVAQSGSTTTATLNGVSQSFAGVTSLYLNGSDGNDTITVDPSVTVGASITGGAGNDTIHGGSGNDTINGGSGTNDMFGGAGNDTVTYAWDNAPVTVSLDDVANDGAAGQGDDVHSDIETVIGGNGNDSLTGDDAANYLSGGPGNDSLYGMGGNDTLNGGLGADLLSGGAGIDTADYSDRSQALTISLDGIANDGAAGEGDNVLPDVEDVIGGSGDDHLIGDAANNVLNGGPGDDTLTAGTGDDTLIGGAGNNTADFSALTANLTITLNGGTGASGGSETGAAGQADVIGPDIENAIGGSGNDVIIGDAQPNLLQGGPGDDSLYGNAGNDTLVGGTGADLLSGGAGYDTADYSASTANLYLSNDGVAHSGAPGEGDTILPDVETLTGGSGNDLIVQHGGVGWAFGNAGNDTLIGGGGSGYYFGGDGNDLIDIQDGVQTFADAGAGTDTVIADANDTVVNAETVITAPQGTLLSGAVIGTAGSYGNLGNTAANAFDGNLNTFFDGPDATGDYVGLDLGAGTTATITRVGFAPRSGFAARMVGGVFQGSNSSDFANAVTLYTVATQPALGQLTILPLPAAGAFRYLRYLGPPSSDSDVAEVQFFGTATTTPTVVQLTGTTYGTPGSYLNDGNTIANATDGNLNTFFDAPSNSGGNVGINLGSAKSVTKIAFAPRAAYPGRMVGGEFQYSTSPTFASGITTVYTVTAAPAVGVLTTVNISAPPEQYWRYIGPAGAFCNIAEFQLFGPATTSPTPTPVRLTGTTYGTVGSYLNDGNTIANATDGNLNTFFDAPSNSGGNVGIDLGSARAVTEIAYAPRANYASRMVGGQFQVSTSMTFSTGVTTVYTVTAAPAYGQLTFVPVSLPTTYRYWRYIGPAGAFCNIAEFELFG